MPWATDICNLTVRAYLYYDWCALINDSAATGLREGLYGTGPFIVEDPQHLLTELYNGSDVDYSKGRVVKIIVPKVEIETSSPVAENSPQTFKGGTTDFGDPCAQTDAGQALVVFYKDAENPDYSIKNFDVNLKVKITPDGSLPPSSFYAYWSKVSGPNSGSLNANVGNTVKFQNLMEGGLYMFECNLVGLGLPTSGANVLLPLGGPDVTAYFLSEAQRYDAWMSALRERLFDASASEYARGVLVLAYFAKTIANMNHKYGIYESGDSPCKRYCDGTVTISGHVFGKDHIGNFLYAYMSARIELNLRQTRWCADFIDILHRKRDAPDDQAAYAAGHALGLNPYRDFRAIPEELNILTMQSESAKKGWPSEDVATGVLYPTWGATPGINTPD